MRERASWDKAPTGDILPWTSAFVPMHQDPMSFASRNNYRSPALFGLAGDLWEAQEEMQAAYFIIFISKNKSALVLTAGVWRLKQPKGCHRQQAQQENQFVLTHNRVI